MGFLRKATVRWHRLAVYFASSALFSVLLSLQSTALTQPKPDRAPPITPLFIFILKYGNALIVPSVSYCRASGTNSLSSDKQYKRGKTDCSF